MVRGDLSTSGGASSTKPHAYKTRDLATMEKKKKNHSLQLGSKTTQTLHRLSSQENALDI